DYGYQENLDGLNIGNYLNSEIGLTFHNYWRLFGGANRTFSYFDDKLTYDNETKKVGPASKLPRTDGLYLSFRTDHTKPFIIEGSISRARSVIGDWGRQFSFLLNIQPSSAIETSVYYSRNRSFERFHWLEITEEIINEDFPDSIDHHYMFAESNNRGNILTWRLSAGLSTDKSVEFYSEYFTNRNKFSDEQYLELIQECTYPDYTDYQPYSTDPDDSSLLDPNLYSPLFAKYSSLNLNFVFRWEYSPGSTLYFIYTIAKSINGKESDRISDFWNYNGGEDWTEFLNESSVYVKINYRFNR
ncbi:MAG: hypothetical protein ACE5D7_11480, partial [Fidelibacterota bacterium]